MEGVCGAGGGAIAGECGDDGGVTGWLPEGAPLGSLPEARNICSVLSSSGSYRTPSGKLWLMFRKRAAGSADG